MVKMRTDTLIHNRNHRLKAFLGKSLWGRPGSRSGELTVVNYHGTPEKFNANFRAQLDYLLRHYAPIRPSELPDFYKGRLNKNKPLFLITFDDGLRNNLHAAKILDEHNISAYFFVVPDFINTRPEQQPEYFLEHIRPVINPYIDGDKEDQAALSWDDLISLHKRGHAIGSHTQTHTLVADRSTKENSLLEIAGSKKNIISGLSGTDVKVNAFCSINNTLESVSLPEAQLIREHYDYHFTTLAGTNSPDTGSQFIRRVNIESFWLEGAVRFALSKWDFKRWEPARQKYASILTAASD